MLKAAVNKLSVTDHKDVENCFADAYEDNLHGIDPSRVELYKLCEQLDIGITCMKPFAGGGLFDAQRSPFGVALTPVQCMPCTVW